MPQYRAETTFFAVGYRAPEALVSNGGGRPRELWKSGGRGTVWNVEIARPDGFPERRQWRVLNVEADGTMEFQDVETEEIISFVPLDEQYW